MPIRGLDNLRLRLGMAIITLNLMAILNDGLELPAHVGSHWGIGSGFFQEDDGLVPSCDPRLGRASR